MEDSRISLENGKYTITVNIEHGISILRHGENWMGFNDLAFPSKVMLSIMGEIEELRAQVALLKGFK